MNINPFAVQAPDSVEHTISKANATCVRFNHGSSLFAGHYMAAGRTDGSVVVLSVETKGVLRMLEGHVKAVTGVSWSRYNRYLATSSLDGNVIVWDLRHAERAHTLRFDAPVSNVQFSTTNSHVLVVVLQSQQAIFIDLRKRKRRRRGNDNKQLSNGTSSNFHALPLKPLSEVIESRAELCLDSGDSGTILCVAFAVDSSSTIVLGTSKGDLLVLDAETHTLLQRVNCGSSGVREVAFDRLGRTLVTNSNDRAVRLFSYSVQRRHVDEQGSGTQSEGEDRATITLLHRFQDLVNRTPWSGVGFSGDGEYVFGGATHKAAHNIYIWDRGAGVLDKILQGPRDSLVNVDWHPSRPLLASVSHTGAINVWFNGPTEVYSAYAPGFEELEENVVYEEREDEFDLEDEEEVSRRKQDEEEAHVDILSLGLQQHSAAAAAAAVISSKRRRKPNGGAKDELSTMDLDDELDDDVETDTDDDDDETFVIPVRLSLELPDLELDD